VLTMIGNVDLAGKSGEDDQMFLLGVNVIVKDGQLCVRSFLPNSVCEGKLQVRSHSDVLGHYPTCYCSNIAH
jgi:hypothetical protein